MVRSQCFVLHMYLVVFPSTWCTRTHIFSIKYSHQQIYIYAHGFRPHSTPCMIYRPLRKVLITTTTAYSVRTGKYKRTTDTIPALPTSTHIDKRPVSLYALISFNNVHFCFRYYFPFLFILHIVRIGHMLSAKHKCVCGVLDKTMDEVILEFKLQSTWTKHGGTETTQFLFLPVLSKPTEISPTIRPINRWIEAEIIGCDNNVLRLAKNNWVPLRSCEIVEINDISNASELYWKYCSITWTLDSLAVFKINYEHWFWQRHNCHTAPLADWLSVRNLVQIHIYRQFCNCFLCAVCRQLQVMCGRNAH